MIRVFDYYYAKLKKIWSILRLMDGFPKGGVATAAPTVSNLCAKPGYMDIRMQHNNNMEPIGDAAFNEDRNMQDRILRILSYTDVPTNVIFLYFNNKFPEEPPSCSLFGDDELSDTSMVSDEGGKSKGQYNIFPGAVTSKIRENRPTDSCYIEGIVTRVHMPSEEFAEVVVLGPKRRFWSRIWKWLRQKARCL